MWRLRLWQQAGLRLHSTPFPVVADAVVGILAGMLPLSVGEVPPRPDPCAYMDINGHSSEEAKKRRKDDEELWRRKLCDVPSIDTYDDLVHWFTSGEFPDDEVAQAAETNWRVGPFAMAQQL